MMRILVTGSQGFVGKNLIENLKNIRDRKDKTRPNLNITAIYEYDKDTDDTVLEEACQKCRSVRILLAFFLYSLSTSL